MKHDDFLVLPGKKVRLRDFDPGFTGKFQHKDEVEEKLVTEKEAEQIRKSISTKLSIILEKLRGCAIPAD